MAQRRTSEGALGGPSKQSNGHVQRPVQQIQLKIGRPESTEQCLPQVLLWQNVISLNLLKHLNRVSVNASTAVKKNVKKKKRKSPGLHTDEYLNRILVCGCYREYSAHLSLSLSFILCQFTLSGRSFSCTL